MFDLFSIYIFYYKILYFKISWKEKKTKKISQRSPKVEVRRLGCFSDGQLFKNAVGFKEKRAERTLTMVDFLK